MLRILICLLMASLWVDAAQAQGSTMPGYTIVDLGPLNLGGGERVQRDPKAAFANIENERMKSVLELQNQITMINALTAWQTQITKLEETYIQAGLSFTPPPPPRHLCEQVPPNAVCSDAYADLAPPDAEPAAETPKSVVATKDKTKTPEKPPVIYEWADIRCMAGDCRATIIDMASGMRMTGTEGEMVAEGVVVQSITPSGVRVTIDGAGTDLRPSDAPAHNMPKAAVAMPANDLQVLLNNTPGGAAAQQQAQQEAAAPSPSSAQGMTTTTTTTTTAPAQPIVLDDGSGAAASPPPLGPTGLF